MYAPGEPQQPAPQQSSSGSSASGQLRDPQVQRQVNEHGLGVPLVQPEPRKWWWTALGLSALVLAVVGGVLTRATQQERLVVIIVGCIALAGVVGASWFFGRRPPRLPVLLFENGLVLTPSTVGGPIGARWEEIRLLRKSAPSGRAHLWLMFVPRGQWQFDSAEIPEVILQQRSLQFARAPEVVRNGGEWDFSGWRISREGLRVASGAYRWDQIEVELHAHGQGVQALSPNPTPKLTLRRLGDNLIIDELQTEDADAFLPIAGLV